MKKKKKKRFSSQFTIGLKTSQSIDLAFAEIV